MISSLQHFFELILHIIAQQVQRWAKPGNPSMLSGAIIDLTRSRSELVLENAFLRQQIIVLNRQVKRPQLTNGDRIRLVLLARCTQFWRQALHVVQTDTLLHWHRDLSRRYWRLGSRNKKPKPPIASETIALVTQMTRKTAPKARNALAGNC